MGGNVTLAEEGRFRRIDAAGDKRGRHLAHIGAQRRRIDIDGQRVEVGKEEKAFRFILHSHPAKDSAQQIAEVQVAGRLDTGDDALRLPGHTESLPALPRRLSSACISSLPIPPISQTIGK